MVLFVMPWQHATCYVNGCDARRHCRGIWCQSADRGCLYLPLVFMAGCHCAVVAGTNSRLPACQALPCGIGQGCNDGAGKGGSWCMSNRSFTPPFQAQCANDQPRHSFPIMLSATLHASIQVESLQICLLLHSNVQSTKTRVLSITNPDYSHPFLSLAFLSAGNRALQIFCAKHTHARPCHPCG